MKFCLLVTVALDIFIKEKNNTLYLGLLLCHFSMQKCLLGQNKTPRILQPLPAYYILNKFPTPAYYNSPPPVYSGP